jgi:hypothetical protein
MLSGLALSLLIAIGIVALTNRALARAQPALFFGVSFFIAAFLPVQQWFDVYIRVAAGGVSLLLLAIQLSGYSPRLLASIRTELVLLAGAIAGIVLSQTAWALESDRSGRLTTAAMLLAGAFALTGAARVAIAMARALRSRPKTT